MAESDQALDQSYDKKNAINCLLIQYAGDAGRKRLRQSLHQALQLLLREDCADVAAQTPVQDEACWVGNGSQDDPAFLDNLSAHVTGRV